MPDLEPQGEHNLLLQLSRTVERLEERLEQSENVTAHRAARAGFQERPGPFTPEILNARPLVQLKSLKADRYDGTTDPYLHVDNFRSIVTGKGYTMASLCHTFQETLTGEALSWFFDLKPNSISSYTQLCDEFAERFILRTDGYRTTAHLFKMQQGDSETLKTFVNRWQTATARCRDLDKPLAYAAFIQALRKGHFLLELNTRHPLDYDQLMTVATRHAQAEFDTYGNEPSPIKSTPQPPVPTDRIRGDINQSSEASNIRSTGRYGNPHSQKGKEAISNPGPDRNTRHGNKGTPYRSQTQSARYSVFTVLTATYEEIFDQCKDEIPGPRQKNFRRPPIMGTGKYCKYHKDGGHDTNFCIALKDMIQSLINEGKLNQYKPRQEVHNVTQVRGQINTIDGGGLLGGPSSHRSKKRCTRAGHSREIFNVHQYRSSSVRKTGWSPITFEESEEGTLQQPHNDPFLINAQVDQFRMARILVDSGSAVNVLFHPAYQQLERPKSRLYQDHEPLLSFSGDIT